MDTRFLSDADRDFARNAAAEWLVDDNDCAPDYYNTLDRLRYFQESKGLSIAHRRVRNNESRRYNLREFGITTPNNKTIGFE